MDLKALAKMIDHSILHPTLSDSDIERECNIALKYNVASVCVKPYAVNQAARILKGSDVKVGTVVGFPHGNSTIAVKVLEAKTACKEGAQEIDMVINIGKVQSSDWSYIRKEIKELCAVCHRYQAILKVIFETDFIKENENKIHLCRICSEEGADYIKTSSGFGFVKKADGNYNYRGATVDDIKLMRQYTGPHVLVKAAGGIRTLDRLLAVKEAGATRIGASATVQILTEAQKRF